MGACLRGPLWSWQLLSTPLLPCLSRPAAAAKWDWANTDKTVDPLRRALEQLEAAKMGTPFDERFTVWDSVDMKSDFEPADLEHKFKAYVATVTPSLTAVQSQLQWLYNNQRSRITLGLD